MGFLDLAGLSHFKDKLIEKIDAEKAPAYVETVGKYARSNTVSNSTHVRVKADRFDRFPVMFSNEANLCPYIPNNSWDGGALVSGRTAGFYNIPNNPVVRFNGKTTSSDSYQFVFGSIPEELKNKTAHIFIRSNVAISQTSAPDITIELYRNKFSLYSTLTVSSDYETDVFNIETTMKIPSVVTEMSISIYLEAETILDNVDVWVGVYDNDAVITNTQTYIPLDGEARFEIPSGYAVIDSMAHANALEGFSNMKDIVIELMSKQLNNNYIYRGKHLGTSVTAAQYKAISSGTFDDLYIGDYWTIAGNDWVICDFDYYFSNDGDGGELKTHHVVIMPRNAMNIPQGTLLYGTNETLTLLDEENNVVKKWNPTNSTIGGYASSRMRTVIMKAANTIVINAFGENHVLPINEMYPDPDHLTTTGVADFSRWFGVQDQTHLLCQSICDLCNETMVFGQQLYSHGSGYDKVVHEVGIDSSQLAIFSMRRDFRTMSSAWWLRSVISDTAVSSVTTLAYKSSANIGLRSVRPRFLLVG